MSSSTGTVVFNDAKIKSVEVVATENIGVGTINPTSNLHLVGNAYVSSNLEVGTANLFVDTTTGRVGVGTVSPGALLELSSDTGSTPGTVVPTQIRISSVTSASDWDTSNDWGMVSFYSTDGSGAGPADVVAIGARAVGAVGGTAALTFRTKSGDAFPLAEAMCILHDGKVGIGTDNPTSTLDVAQNGEGTYIGRVINTNTGSDEDARFVIETTSSSGESQLIFITTDGTTKNLWHISAGSGDTPNLGFYYSPTDYNGGTSAGYITRKSDNVSLNFTGQHRTFIKDVPFTEATNLEGLIVSADQNKYIKMSGGIEAGSNAITTNESLPIVSLSTTSNDKKCFGVISAYEDPETREEQYGNFVSVSEKEQGDTRVYINSVGEGAIWVTNTNGPLESGDYITTSNVAGYGMKQDSEFLANYTVAKITMDCDFNPPTQPKQQIVKELANVNYYKNTSNTIINENQYNDLNVEQKEEYTLEVRQEMVNVLDEHRQIQWEDHPTETEKAYKIRYLTADGTQTDEANAVHIAAFVGCTYHCG